MTMPSCVVHQHVRQEGLSFDNDALLAVECMHDFTCSDAYTTLVYAEGMPLKKAIDDALKHHLPFTQQMNRYIEATQGLSAIGLRAGFEDIYKH